jgi:tellurite resistance protein
MQKPPRIAPIQPRPGLWAATPPAIFPPILGLMGLGLAWRRAAVVYGLPIQVSDLILGAVILLLAFAWLTYLAKVLRGPRTLVADLAILPGRGGLAAATMGLAAAAAALVPVAPDLARGLWWVALAAHAAVALLVAKSLIEAPPEGRLVSPVWHLAFVGFIVLGLSAAELGHQTLLAAILAVTLAAAGFIWLASLAQLTRVTPPPPLRPLLVVHLAPASLFGLVAMPAGHPGLAFGFAVVSLALALGLAASARWLLAGGFTPFWGAMTFPLAAFAGLMVAQSGQALAFAVAGPVALVAATVLVPWIAYRVLKLWASGRLSAVTNAARL